MQESLIHFILNTIPCTVCTHMWLLSVMQSYELASRAVPRPGERGRRLRRKRNKIRSTPVSLSLSPLSLSLLSLSLSNPIKLYVSLQDEEEVYKDSNIFMKVCKHTLSYTAMTHTHVFYSIVHTHSLPLSLLVHFTFNPLLTGNPECQPHTTITSQHFVDTCQRPQNFIRDVGMAERFREYPKLRELMRLKV